MKNQTILFAAGGTGGHVIPAFVLAKAIVEKYPDARCVFVGAKGKFEEAWIPKQGFEIELLDMGGFKSGSLLKRIQGLLKIPSAFLQSRRILKKYRPDRIFGIGGYTSGPIMLLASLQGIPCAILEPNAAAGFSNRVLSRFVKRVYIVFDQVKEVFPKGKIKNYGHLIRKSILDIASPNFKTSMKTVTILGGSQGSKKVNQVFCQMLEEKISNLKNEITIIHQTGSLDYENVVQKYKNINMTNTVAPFFDNMEEIYGRSHIIIARSGSSVLEFASIGIPSILIPLSIAADDHQLENAKSVARTHGAVIIEEKNYSPQTLFEELMKLLHSDLSKLSFALKRLRRENAVQDIMEDFLALG